MEKTKRLKMRFSKEQLFIILSKDHKILVNASAGTGKTHTLIAAATRVMKTEKNTKVAVFTFTKDAANELKGRMEILPTFIGTIHSFAMQEIKKLEKENKIVSELMDEKEVKKLLLHCYVQRYEIKRDYKKELSEIFRFLTDKTFIPDLGVAAKYSAVINDYNKKKKELKKYDYMDSPEYLLIKLEETKSKIDYTHLYVDEVQDIDLHEYELIKKFQGNVFAIGDPRQSIYQFRNSISHTFEKMQNLGYNLYELKTNYRSFQEILDFADSDLTASRGNGGEIAGADLLEDPETIVLCRYNEEVRLLSGLFNKVRTIHSFKGLESEKVVVINFSTHNEENQNIMFVAKTRAMNKIGVCTLEEALKKGRKIKYGY